MNKISKISISVLVVITFAVGIYYFSDFNNVENMEANYDSLILKNGDEIQVNLEIEKKECIENYNEYGEELVCHAVALRDYLVCDKIIDEIVSKKCKDLVLIAQQYDEKGLSGIDCSKIKNFIYCDEIKKEGFSINYTDIKKQALQEAVKNKNDEICKNERESLCEDRYLFRMAAEFNEVEYCFNIKNDINRIMCRNNLDSENNCENLDCVALGLNNESYCDLYEGYSEKISNCKQNFVI